MTKLEEIAKQRWEAFHEFDAIWSVREVGCDLNHAHLVTAAPEMLELLLEQQAMGRGDSDFASRAKWRDKRDALIARLRKECET